MPLSKKVYPNHAGPKASAVESTGPAGLGSNVDVLGIFPSLSGGEPQQASRRAFVSCCRALWLKM